MVFKLKFGKGLSTKQRKEIISAVAEEKRKQARLKFEARKARAVERVRNPLSKRFRGVAVKAGERARKDIGKSLKGFAREIGKPKKVEKETIVIIDGKPKRIKGRVRIVQPASSALSGGFGDLGLNVGLLGDEPRRKTKEKRFKPIRFF